jgi:2-methylisocitrate lyase-like PEP mutase family enzyme
MSTETTTAAKRRSFRALHVAGCFLLPNPWDAGSARYLQHLGFKAIATTSSGFAWSQGLADGAVARDAMLAHLREMASAVDLPVNADFGNGFAHAPDQVAQNVRLALATGIAGLSIEDATGDPARPLYDLDAAIARMRAARAAIDAGGVDVLLVGRAECFLVGRPDLDETIARLRAYSNAGADCLYAPGLTTREQIAAVVAAVAPKPVNLLVWKPTDLSLAEIAALGVRRVSIGGALARTAWAGFMRAAQALAAGDFAALGQAASGAELDALFGR